MSVHVMCITSGGGLPVFSRSKGNGENLPFSVIGSLNGVHMFAKSQKIDLLNTLTEDYVVVWKEFHDSLVLIGISSGCTDAVLNKVLESVFKAVVLIVGLDEVKSQRNIERLKRELRVCYPVIDRILNCLDYGEASNKHSCDIVSLVETILCPENHLLQIVLDSYTECVDSLFSCILIHGKIAVATESWWTLHADELKLLSLLATTETTTASKDIPIFLPHKSPNAAFRFVTCTLLPDVQVCCLCGQTPSLEDIEHSAAQCFKSTLEILSSAVKCHPRNFPNTLLLDGGILGILLINTHLGKYMISKNPQQNLAKRTGNSSHRLDILRTFYYRAVLNVLCDEEQDSNKQESNANADRRSQTLQTNDNDKICVGKETYWCSEYHKCLAIKDDDNILCVLFSSSIPTHAMRLISQKTLKLLTLDKQVCW